MKDNQYTLYPLRGGGEGRGGGEYKKSILLNTCISCHSAIYNVVINPSISIEEKQIKME